VYWTYYVRASLVLPVPFNKLRSFQIGLSQLNIVNLINMTFQVLHIWCSGNWWSINWRGSGLGTRHWV